MRTPGSKTKFEGLERETVDVGLTWDPCLMNGRASALPVLVPVWLSIRASKRHLDFASLVNFGDIASHHSQIQSKCGAPRIHQTIRQFCTELCSSEIQPRTVVFYQSTCPVQSTYLSHPGTL